MYVQQSLQDNLFLMLYGAIAILALATGLYLWLRRSNTIAPDVTPPKALVPMYGSLLHHRGTEPHLVVCAGHLLAD